MFCLQSHYRKGLVFSWENLDNAVGTFNKLIGRIANLKPGDDVDQAVFDELKAKFVAALENDLNTAQAMTAVYDVLKAKTTDATKLAVLADYDYVLSLDLIAKAEAKRQENAKAAAAKKSEGGYTIVGEGDPAIDALVMQRYEAKKAKNFAEADRIRDELKAQGIEIIDVAGGAQWKKI